MWYENDYVGMCEGSCGMLSIPFAAIFSLSCFVGVGRPGDALSKPAKFTSIVEKTVKQR